MLDQAKTINTLTLGCSQFSTLNISDHIATPPECIFGFGHNFGRMEAETETKSKPDYGPKPKTKPKVRSDNRQR